MAEFDVGAVDRLLTTTRAVRKRLDLTRPVATRVILDCIEVAQQAPSGANTQPWRWLVVTDPKLRQGIAEYYQDAYRRYIEPRAAAVDPSDATTRRIMESSDYLAEHLAEVPVLVIPCGLARPETVTGGDGGASFFGGVLPAVWSFQLALRARGLGSAWTTLHLNYERDVARLLGIPDTVMQVALLPVAYYTGVGFKRARRKSAEQVTYWNGWKQPVVE